MTPATPPDLTRHNHRSHDLRFMLVMVGTAVMYAALTLAFSLPSLIRTAHASIGTVTQRSTSGSTLLALAGIVLYGLYVYGALLIWHARATPRTTRAIWIGAIGVSLLLAWSYPVTSTDIFDYLFRARMAVMYGANPYLALPNQFKQDPFFVHIGWPNAPSAYGPLWEIGSQLVVRTGGESLLLNVLLYKGLAISAFLLSGVVIWKLVDNPDLRQLSVYLWLWSPLALWEFAATGHNDGLLILSLLLALWAVGNNRHWLAVLALTAGTLFKFLPAIFLPLVVLDWMRRQPSWAARVQVLSIALASFVIPAIMLYAPFWDLPPSFEHLDWAGKFGAIWAGRTTTLHNIAVRELFLNASPLAVISYLLRTTESLARINAIIMSLGYPAATSDDLRSLISTLGTALLGLGILWQSWRVWWGTHKLQAAFFGLLLWYILAGSQWFQPWYVLWVLALFVLWPVPQTFGWLTAWAMTAQSSYLLQYIILPNLQIPGQSLEAQLYYLLLIYPLPCCIWLGSWWRGRASPRLPRSHTEHAARL